jgi:hypothetical protein
MYPALVRGAMTAGPEGIRGPLTGPDRPPRSVLGPRRANHRGALIKRDDAAACPDPGFLTVCHHVPMPFPTAFGRARRPSGGPGERGAIIFVPGQHGPDDARGLGGAGDGGDLDRPSGQQGSWRRCALAPTISRVRRLRWPCLEMPPERRLPAVLCWRGVSPSQAAKPRPERQALASGTVARTALATIGPTPGIAVSRRATRSSRTAWTMHRSRVVMSVSSACQCRARLASAACAASGSPRGRGQQRHQLAQSPTALRRHHAELGKRRAQRIGGHGALAHQQLTGAMQRQHRLLLGVLHRHKAHARALHGLADRLGVAAIGLVALHARLDVGRRHQPHLVAERLQPPRPVVRAAARLHPVHRRRQRGEEPLDLAAPQPLAQDHVAGGVDAVKLEDVLRQIQTDHASLHRGRLRSLVGSRHPVWHIDAVRGPSTPSSRDREAVVATQARLGRRDCHGAPRYARWGIRAIAAGIGAWEMASLGVVTTHPREP